MKIKVNEYFEQLSSLLLFCFDIKDLDIANLISANRALGSVGCHHAFGAFAAHRDMPTWSAKNVFGLRHTNDACVIILIVRVGHTESFLKLITPAVLNYNSRLWSDLNGTVISLCVFQETDAFKLHLRNDKLYYQWAIFICSHPSFLWHIKSIKLDRLRLCFYRMLHILLGRCRLIMVRKVHNHFLINGLNHIKMVLSSLINSVRIPRVDSQLIRMLRMDVKLKVYHQVLIQNLNTGGVNIRMVLQCLQI